MRCIHSKDRPQRRTLENVEPFGVQLPIHNCSEQPGPRDLQFPLVNARKIGLVDGHAVQGGKITNWEIVFWLIMRLRLIQRQDTYNRLIFLGNFLPKIRSQDGRVISCLAKLRKIPGSHPNKRVPAINQLECRAKAYQAERCSCIKAFEDKDQDADN